MKPVFRSPLQKIVDTRHAHAARCSKPPDECHVCKQNIDYFNSLSLVELTQALEDKPTPAMRVPVILLARDNFIDGTTRNTKRAKADGLVARRVVVNYIAVNGEPR